MTTDEFWNQSPPAFLRYIVCRPPEDWPMVGLNRSYDVHEARRDYVRVNLGGVMGKNAAARLARIKPKEKKTKKVSTGSVPAVPLPQVIVGDQQDLFAA